MFNLSKISFTSKSTLLGSFCYVYYDHKNKKYFAREKVRVTLSKGFSSTTISSVVSSFCFNFEEFAIRRFTLGSVVRCRHFDLSARKKQSKNSLLAKDIFTASLS